MAVPRSRLLGMCGQVPNRTGPPPGGPAAGLRWNCSTRSARAAYANGGKAVVRIGVGKFAEALRLSARPAHPHFRSVSPAGQPGRFPR